MATGSQSDVSEDFNAQAVDKKKSKPFSKPTFLKKNKTHRNGKRSTDISSSPYFGTMHKIPPVNT